MSFQHKKLGLAALLVVFFLLPIQAAAQIPIEETTSQRESIRNYTGASITQQQMLNVLKDAYGFWGNHVSVPKVGSDYSLTLYAVNTTGTYLYHPETNTLGVYDLSVNKESIGPRIPQGYSSSASAVVIVIWNQTRMNNVYFASAEAGCIVQNIHLSALSLGLGTVCVTSIDPDGIRSDLRLQASMIPLLVMPIGYPTSPYPSASPDHTRMNGNLPPVQYSQRSFEDAVSNLLYAQGWSGQTLSTQEISQLLWAGYGYSSTGHRTVPAAVGVYTDVICFANATGVYKYIPETHSVTTIGTGDKRLEIANACGGQTWAANAPTLFVISYDSSLGNDGGIVSHEWVEVNTGTVVQSMLLEAAARNLSGNIVSKGLENWNGAAAASIRNTLGLSSSIIPLYAIPIGSGGQIPEFSPLLFFAFFIIVSFGIVVFYKNFSQQYKGKVHE